MTPNPIVGGGDDDDDDDVVIAATSSSPSSPSRIDTEAITSPSPLNGRGGSLRSRGIVRAQSQPQTSFIIPNHSSNGQSDVLC